MAESAILNSCFLCHTAPLVPDRGRRDNAFAVVEVLARRLGGLECGRGINPGAVAGCSLSLRGAGWFSLKRDAYTITS